MSLNLLSIPKISETMFLTAIKAEATTDEKEDALGIRIRILLQAAIGGI